jgi:hypothetical protein
MFSVKETERQIDKVSNERQMLKVKCHFFTTKLLHISLAKFILLIISKSPFTAEKKENGFFNSYAFSQ